MRAILQIHRPEPAILKREDATRRTGHIRVMCRNDNGLTLICTVRLKERA